ncbi:MAG: hypothetical protein ACRCUS_00980 [Anaerovoracaceae bacterium]
MENETIIQILSIAAFALGVLFGDRFVRLPKEMHESAAAEKYKKEARERAALLAKEEKDEKYD